MKTVLSGGAEGAATNMALRCQPTQTALAQKTGKMLKGGCSDHVHSLGSGTPKLP
jgi:hypothetical protein